jgi:hygromycin-B 4-O-kinase
VQAHVSAFFSQRFGDAQIEPVGHGEWSRAFFVGNRVVRFSATDDDFLKDRRAYDLAAGRVPIPHVLEIGRAGDQWFSVSERVRGRFLEDRDAAGMQRVLHSLFATLDAVREVDVSRSSGFGLWRGSDGTGPFATWREALLTVAPSPRQVGWQAALRQLPGPQRIFERAYSSMARLVDSCPNDRHLVHSDMLNFNVLVQDDAVSTVLDWGSSIFGDFLWDLAWFTFWQPWYTAWSSLDLRQAALDHYAAIDLEVPNFDRRLRCYELAIGLDGLAYQAWAGKPTVEWTARRLEDLITP